MYTIDKNIPLPPRRTNSASVTACLVKMAVGDSVLIDNKHKSSFYQSAHRNNNGMKLTLRKIGEEKTRIWRIE